MSALHDLGVRDAAARIRRREISSAELTRAALARIAAVDDRGRRVPHACADAEALAAAEAIDRRVAAGDDAGPLAGVPVGVKDIICTAGVRTTAGSRILERFVPPYDATVVARLRAPGAVLVGKLNCDEFAMGSSNENSAYGATRNPWDRDARARRLVGRLGARRSRRARCAAALGTDTGGSIRQPAAFCGVVGLKPTYGRVSRYGVIAFASSLDQVGPFARDVGDCGARARGDRRPRPGRLDRRRRARCRATPTRSASGVRGLRLGLPQRVLRRGHAARGRARRCAPRSTELERLGAAVEPVSLPHTEYADRHLLPDRHRRGVVEPRALRRRPLRRCASSGRRRPRARCTSATRAAGLRRRGEAPHHARHLRALGGLLRRLLPEGAAGAHAHPARLRAGASRAATCSSRRSRRRRRSASARRPTIRSDVPLRHLHHLGEPRRPARPRRARAASTRAGLPDRPAAHRPPVRRGDRAARRRTPTSRRPTGTAGSPLP